MSSSRWKETTCITVAAARFRILIKNIAVLPECDISSSSPLFASKRMHIHSGLSFVMLHPLTRSLRLPRHPRIQNAGNFPENFSNKWTAETAACTRYKSRVTFTTPVFMVAANSRRSRKRANDSVEHAADILKIIHAKVEKNAILKKDIIDLFQIMREIMQKIYIWCVKSKEAV